MHTEELKIEIQETPIETKKRHKKINIREVKKGRTVRIRKYTEPFEKFASITFKLRTVKVKNVRRSH